MMLLPVPRCAAPDEMLTMTPSPDRLQQRREGADRRERPAHIGGQHLVDQIVVERFEVADARTMRVKPAELTRMSARPNSSLDRGGDLRLICAVSSSGRCIGRVAAAGQLGDDRVGAVDALVVADDDARPGLGEQPRAGRADAAATRRSPPRPCRREPCRSAAMIVSFAIEAFPRMLRGRIGVLSPSSHTGGRRRRRR